MERLGSVGFGSVLLVCLMMSGASALLHSANLHSQCKSCDPQPATCKSYQCISNCSVSKVCPNPQDVCAAVWWRDAGIVTVETRCHDPTQPLHGVMLEDYSSSDCVLTIRYASGRHLRLCACTGHECNERMLLNKPSEDSELVILSASETKPFKLPQLCKFCDIESTMCNATGVCKSSCNITSICEDPDQVCASAWRRSEGITIIETVCHNPALPFHGQYLKDFNSSRCEMKRVKGTEDDFYICSCNKEECNDRLIFTDDAGPVSPGVDQKKLLPLLLVILVPLVMAVLLVSLFYFYCVSKSPRPALTLTV